jgi:hypothetical protein
VGCYRCRSSDTFRWSSLPTTSVGVEELVTCVRRPLLSVAEGRTPEDDENATSGHRVPSNELLSEQAEHRAPVSAPDQFVGRIGFQSVRGAVGTCVDSQSGG